MIGGRAKRVQKSEYERQLSYSKSVKPRSSLMLIIIHAGVISFVAAMCCGINMLSYHVSSVAQINRVEWVRSGQVKVR